MVTIVSPFHALVLAVMPHTGAAAVTEAVVAPVLPPHHTAFLIAFRSGNTARTLAVAVLISLFPFLFLPIAPLLFSFVFNVPFLV